MTDHAHFIEICSCGVLIAQCRCLGPKIARTSTSPCLHKYKYQVVTPDTEPPNWQMAAPPKPDLRETCRVAHAALVMANQFFTQRDQMNASVHCGDTRWSPITQMVADARARVDTDMEQHGIPLGPRPTEAG